jgi:tetratricopeptide (TPR) repeat protein
LNSLGVAYASDKQWENAEKVFNDSLKINREMAQGNTQSYLPQIARTQMNIGVLYIERNRRLAAEHAFNQALQIYQNLTKANLPAYRPDLAQTLANRGTLYANWRDEDGNLVKVKQADRDLSDAVRNFRELVESPSGEIYRPHLARALHILGNLYREIERRPDSEELLKESLGIRRKLAEINSMAYSRELAVTLADLSRLYKAEERYAESASLCNEAVGISMKARENKSSDASYESFLRSLYCPPSVKELRGQAKK